MKVNVIIHSIHFDADQKLLSFIEEKINKLGHYFERIIDGEVYLKVENVNNTSNKLVEIRLKIPRNELFAKKISKSFEESTDLAVEAIRKQLIKQKDKLAAI